MTTNRSHIPLACSALLFLAGGGVSIRNGQDRRWIPNCKILPRILSVFSSQSTNISTCMAYKKLGEKKTSIMTIDSYNFCMIICHN